MANYNLGRVLRIGGGAESALTSLVEARRRFQDLADKYSVQAKGMVALIIRDTGTCLRDLGRLEQAAEAYEEALELNKQDNRPRDVAVGKFQLGSVRLLQKRYQESLEIYVEALDSFGVLGEPVQVAKVWHQIGSVHAAAGKLEPAEQAFRQSLAIKVRENDVGGQANTLNELGSLYDKMGLLEQAATFYKEATEAYMRLEDLAKEGGTRSNLADTLTKLRRFEEARPELLRAIECLRPYGHAAELWKPWSLLEQLERTTGHTDAAEAARQQAVGTYLAYRRVGGVSQSNQARLFALVAQAIQDGSENVARQQLNALLEPGDPPSFIALIRQLQCVLSGDRNPALADDPEFDYMTAAELRLLLESLLPAEGPAP